MKISCDVSEVLFNIDFEKATTIGKTSDRKCYIDWLDKKFNTDLYEAVGRMLLMYKKDHKNFRLINNISIDSYEPGKKIVKSFLLGYESLKKEYDFIVKLDADILLPLNYFKKISSAFKKENIGIVGGYLYQKNKNGKWFLEHAMDKNHVRGAIKAYSKDCYKSIGGLKPTMGWDSVDELLAFYNGFKVKTLPNLKVKHLRIPNKRF